MAKLTAEQKAANKEIFKARDRAYNARKGAYRKARENALAQYGTGPEKKAYEEADAAFNQAFDRVEAERRAIDDQIRVLREQQEGLRAKHNVDTLADARRKASDVHFKGRMAVEARIDSEYPDVAGVHSAVEWAANGHFTPELAEQV
ncbi:hypothetical protein AB4Y45_33850 [Paraburkholderia sp. EG287A]|uniref:hypothetical protein n=1 Tax=Paraburkholderia sp. EG287A TaxID=3237012 RepID=UPI0034D2F1A6